MELYKLKVSSQFLQCEELQHQRSPTHRLQATSNFPLGSLQYRLKWYMNINATYECPLAPPPHWPILTPAHIKFPVANLNKCLCFIFVIVSLRSNRKEKIKGCVYWLVWGGLPSFLCPCQHQYPHPAPPPTNTLTSSVKWHQIPKVAPYTGQDSNSRGRGGGLRL